MAEKARCGMCDKTFKDADGLTAHNKAKHPEKIPKGRKSPPMSKIRNWGVFIIITGLIILGVFWGVSNSKTLPPIDMKGHVELNPLSHVLKEPMSIAIQKHMLEHADGTGKPGVIINYNCEDYDCEESLIENLEGFTSDYDYVYVAPFKGMDAKIVITKLGKINILEAYDENRVRSFIEGK